MNIKFSIYFLFIFFIAKSAFADYLPGTVPLTQLYNFAYTYVTGLAEFVEQRIDETQPSRTNVWNWNYTNIDSYETSCAPHKTNLTAMLRITPGQTKVVSNLWQNIGTGTFYSIEKFSIFTENGITVRGLAVFPSLTNIVPAVIIPVTDPLSPEIIIGIDTNHPNISIGKKFLEKGFAVICPVFINHQEWWSGNPTILTNLLDHRRWLYQQGYHIGKQLIGDETAGIIACVNLLSTDPRIITNSIGVVGRDFDSGASVFFACALDEKIQAVLLSGYFNQRTDIWKQYIEHQFFGFLNEFGDAEIASLIAPRPLIIESPIDFPKVPVNTSSSEFERAKIHYDNLGESDKINFLTPPGGTNIFGCDDAISLFIEFLNIGTNYFQESSLVLTSSYSHINQMRALFYETQNLYQQFCSNSYSVRQTFFWDNIDTSSVANYQISTEPFRSNLIYEMFGNVPDPDIPLQAWSCVYKSNENFVTYHVLMTLYSNVNCYGLLNVPYDIKENEKRPCVVCQHGLEGSPKIISDYAYTNVYHFFAARLADLGFVTFAPQNPTIYGSTFRNIQRRAAVVKWDLMGFILRQHQRGIDFLSSLPFVDSNKIGIYGLSWGGRTASWIGAAEPRYSVVVNSGNFSDAVQKYTSIENIYSYLFLAGYWLPEDDLWKFNRVNKFSHAELAALIAPRPFMVECGWDDDVPRSEWASNEYIKVNQLYNSLGISNETRIEFFDGGHEIHGVGTFEFLKEKLDLIPEPVFIYYYLFIIYHLLKIHFNK